MFKQILLFIFLSCSIASIAQDSLSLAIEPLPLVQIEPATVVASRFSESLSEIPLSISRVGITQLQFGQSQLAINEALDQIPGVFALNATNYAQDLRVSIRGFGARSAFGIRGVKIIVDDLPESTPDGQGQVDNLDIGMLKQMEVLRGPASTLYGNASGGVLNFKTEDFTDRFRTQFRAMTGSFGLQQYQFKIGQKIKRFQYILHANHLKFDGFREHSQVENNQLYGKFSYYFGRRKNAKLLLLINHSNSPIAQDPGGITEEQALDNRRQARDRNLQFNGGEAVLQTRIGLVYSHDFSPGKLKLRAFTTNRDFNNRLPFETGGIVAFQRQFHGMGGSYEFPIKYGSIQGKILAGFDLDIQIDDRQRFNNLEGRLGDLSFDQEESFQNIGIYLIHHLPFNKTWNARIGLRGDFLNLEAKDRFLFNGDDSGSRSYNRLSPSLAIQYRLDNYQQFFASISSNFETPSLGELSNNPIGLGGFNPNLTPQQALNYELGFRGNLTKHFFGALSLFYIQVQDELIPFELELFPGRTFYRNAGSTDRSGAELQLSYIFNKYLQTRLSYTYSRFAYKNFEQFDGNLLPGIPEHAAFFAIRFQRLKGFYGSLQTRFVGELFTNDANTEKDQVYTLVNFRLGYRHFFDNWLIAPFFGINNLFNTKYNANVRINAFGNRFFEPGPELHIYTGIRIEFVKS